MQLRTIRRTVISVPPPLRLALVTVPGESQRLCYRAYVQELQHPEGLPEMSHVLSQVPKWIPLPEIVADAAEVLERGEGW
jgi:hypothetical protein